MPDLRRSVVLLSPSRRICAGSFLPLALTMEVSSNIFFHGDLEVTATGVVYDMISYDFCSKSEAFSLRFGGYSHWYGVP